MHGPSIRKLTPVLFVERIEPSLVLWERQLGWFGSRELTVREPGGHLVTFAQFGGNRDPDAG